jgi:hypothetical protein
VSNLEKLSTYLPEQYSDMQTRISEIMPSVQASSQAFYKSDSQLKMSTLDINDLTDVGSAKHILARIERKRAALKESEIGLRRKRVKLAKKQEKLAGATGYDAELLEIDILELQSQIADTENYQAGAIRELAFLVEQYDAICTKLGVDVITEDMYEADQAQYHVMRAFSQALAAARSRQGLIDEGNFIYLQDLGVNGAAAQREVIAFLEAEQEMLNAGQVPTFDMQYNWLRAVGEKFAGEVARYAEARGLVPLVHEALGTKQLESA